MVFILCYVYVKKQQQQQQKNDDVMKCGKTLCDLCILEDRK